MHGYDLFDENTSALSLDQGSASNTAMHKLQALINSHIANKVAANDQQQVDRQIDRQTDREMCR